MSRVASMETIVAWSSDRRGNGREDESEEGGGRARRRRLFGSVSSIIRVDVPFFSTEATFSRGKRKELDDEHVHEVL